MPARKPTETTTTARGKQHRSFLSFSSVDLSIQTEVQVEVILHHGVILLVVNIQFLAARSVTHRCYQEEAGSTTAATAENDENAEHAEHAETISCLAVKSGQSETTGPEIGLLIIGGIAPCWESRWGDGPKTDDPFRV